MHILFLTSTFHPTIGGAESYALELARGLSRRGHDVSMLTDLVGDALARERLGDVEVLRSHSYRAALSAPQLASWEQMQFALLSEWAEQLAERPRFDLIHANSQDTAIWGAMLALEFGVPLVCTSHEHWPDRGPFGSGRCRLIYDRLPIDLLIAGSEFYLERAQRFSSRLPCRLIYHGVDTELFAPGRDGSQLRAKHGFSRGDKLVVCSGRITPRKNQRELVAAFPDVLRRRPEAKLLLAGTFNSGTIEYLEAVRSDITRLGLAGRVVIDDELTHADMPDLYAAADLVVQPSREEGLGLALLEGMASGVPVLGTDVCGIREVIIDGSTGLLVPLDDRVALAAGIIEGLRAETAQRLGNAGRAAVCGQFSLTRMIDETEAAYRQLVRSFDRGSATHKSSGTDFADNGHSSTHRDAQ